MKASTLKLERIFDSTISYQVPLFQRPYVWTEVNWELLWEDIHPLLNKRLVGEKTRAHFLGAVVLEQLGHTTGSTETRQVIDGQQRFTTLQLFLVAARDLAQKHDSAKYVQCFKHLVENNAAMVNLPHEVFKVWPTNSDRAAFKLAHEAGSLQGLAKELADRGSHDGLSKNIIQAYQYFSAVLAGWMAGKNNPEDDAAFVAKTMDERLDALWQVVRNDLQVVVIDLEADDETQVIFETLNARGEDLLPADLIKNYLFRRCVDVGQDANDIEHLYTKYWQAFESEWWRVKVVQGRIERPRIDLFVQHYLALMTLDDIKTSHLFNAYKDFEREGKAPAGSNIPFPSTPAEHIKQISKYGRVYKSLYDAPPDTRLGRFLERLEVLETSTVLPFILHACAELRPNNDAELDGILDVVESYLIRRMVAGLDTKNYNKHFVELIKSVEAAKEVSVATVSRFLLKSQSESAVFPDDLTVFVILRDTKLYNRLTQKRVRLLLEVLSERLAHDKSEPVTTPKRMTIEHVLPQSWQEYWPVPSDIAADPVAKAKFSEARAAALHKLGNLTLINKRLNPALGNLGWAAKRPEIQQYSMLHINRYFHTPASDSWAEDAINVRGELLAKMLLQTWPLPKVEEPAAT